MLFKKYPSIVRCHHVFGRTVFFILFLPRAQVFPSKPGPGTADSARLSTDKHLGNEISTAGLDLCRLVAFQAGGILQAQFKGWNNVIQDLMLFKKD